MQKKITLLILIVVIGTFSYFPMINVRGTFVSEDSDYITIENDYYIAKIDKNSANKHGHIRQFYIKPNDTINIVSPNTWNFLGGHEANSKWGTTTKTGVDWNAGEKDSQSTSIVEQTNDYVVVECITRWKSGGTYLDYTNIEYTVFFLDQPYYYVSSTRTYNEQAQYLSNDEICFLFDNEWGNRFYHLLHDGSLLNYTGVASQQEVVSVFESRNLGKYPYVMMYNDTNGHGHFTILTSANPSTIGIGYSSYDAGSRYHEYQIVYSTYSVNSGDTHSVTYVSGVADNTTYLDNLATSLYSSTYYGTENYVSQVASNNQTDPIYSPNLNTVLTFSGTSTILGSYSFPMAHPKARIWLYPEYINATDTYNIQLTSPTITQTWNGSYTQVTREKDYESKIRLNVKYEFWNDSDPFRITWNFTTLASLNITELRIRMFGWNGITDGATITQLTSSVVKQNKTKHSSVLYQIPEQAITLKNTTSLNASTSVGGAGDQYAYFYPLKFGSDTVISSGNSYVVTLLIQRHIRFSFESRGTFGIDDVLDVNESNNDRLHNLTWAYFPYLDTSSPFRINHLGGMNALIFDVSRESNQLRFRIVAPNGNTSTTKIYCGSEGIPQRVLGKYVESWTYDLTTQILTIEVLHKSVAEVIIDWGGRSSSTFRLRVHVSKNKFPYLGAIVNVDGGKNQTTNLFGDAVFDVGVGSCLITVYLEDQMERREIFVSRDQSVGFNFDIPVPTDRSIYLFISVPLIFLVVLGVAIFLWRRG